MSTTDNATATDPRPAKLARSTDLGPVFDLASRIGLPVVLVVAVLLFSFATGPLGVVFRSHQNVSNLLSTYAVTGLVAIAMVIPAVAGSFDLSPSAVAGISNVVVATAISTYKLPVGVAVLIGLLIGAVVGFTLGWLVAKVGLDPFIVTFGVLTLFGGLASLYTNDQLIIAGIPNWFTALGNNTVIGVPMPFFIVVVVAIAVWYLLSQVPYGRHLESIGSNREAARLVGVDVTRSIWVAFVLSGVIAGAAGVLQTIRTGTGDPGTTSQFLNPAFAALFLGATMIRPGKYNVWGTLIGVYLIGVAVSGFTLLGASTWVQPVFNGGALVLAVLLSTLVGRARAKRGRRGRQPTATSETAA